MTDVPTELPPVVASSPETCDICGKEFPSAGRLKMHKYGAFSAHKLDKNGNRIAKFGAPKSQRVKPDEVIPPKPKERPAAPARAKTSGPRKNASPILAGVWTGVAMAVVPGFSPAAARAMIWQAEAAGPVLDKAVAGTFLDKLIVQKVAGKTDETKALGSLLGLPVLLMLAERKPELVGLPAMHQALRYAVKCNFEAIMDARIKEKREQERWEAKASEAGIELTIEVQTEEGPARVDVIDAVVRDLLGALVPVPTDEEVAA